MNSLKAHTSSSRIPTTSHSWQKSSQDGSLFGLESAFVSVRRAPAKAGRRPPKLQAVRPSCEAPSALADPSHLLSPGKEVKLSGFLPDGHALDVERILQGHGESLSSPGPHDWHESFEDIRVRLHANRVDIFHGMEHLRVYEDGMLELRRMRRGTCVLITAGRVRRLEQLQWSLS